MLFSWSCWIAFLFSCHSLNFLKTAIVNSPSGKLQISMSLSCYCCCSVTQSCLALCHPIACIMPGFLVLHYLPEFAQTHAHWISDAISSFVIPFSSCSQSSPESGSFPLKRFLHQLFVSGPFSQHIKCISGSRVTNFWQQTAPCTKLFYLSYTVFVMIV